MKHVVWIFTILILATSCLSNSVVDEKYVVLVTDEKGVALENALVTPMSIGQNYKTQLTGIDGRADLADIYQKKPDKIMVRAAGYFSASATWDLPSATPQMIRLKKFNRE